MKLLAFIAAGLFTLTTAIAAPTKSQVNQKAYALLEKNLNKLRNQDNVKLSEIIGEDLKRATKGDPSYKVTNRCSYDSSDSAFKCTLNITHSSHGEESAIEVDYQLERGSNGLPSEFFYYSVETMIAS